jgi:hypothetical protein
VPRLTPPPGIPEAVRPISLSHCGNRDSPPPLWSRHFQRAALDPPGRTPSALPGADKAPSQHHPPRHHSVWVGLHDDDDQVLHTGRSAALAANYRASIARTACVVTSAPAITPTSAADISAFTLCTVLTPTPRVLATLSITARPVRPRSTALATPAPPQRDQRRRTATKPLA